MSCDWDIRCVDCATTLHFSDANHQDELMWALIKHRDAIAALAPLLVDADVELSSHYGRIDPVWFLAHAGHRLVPIDEYGALATACCEYVTCSCGSRRRCTLDLGHAGDHDATKR